jgi:hypothetical protein
MAKRRGTLNGWKALALALLLVVFMAVAKHAIDTAFWTHPSQDELDIFK